MPSHSEISEIIRKRIDGLDDSNGMKDFLYSVLQHELQFVNAGAPRYTELYLKLARKANQGGER